MIDKIKVVMIGNVIIQVAWLAAAVTFALNNLIGLSIVCIIGSVFCGYTYKERNKDKKE